MLWLTGEIPKWWKWAYWVSPMAYTYDALTVNEMLAPRWINQPVKFLLQLLTCLLYDFLFFFFLSSNALLLSLQSSDNSTSLGLAVLEIFDIFTDPNWYWIGVGGILGFTVLFNILVTLALTFLNRKYTYID